MSNTFSLVVKKVNRSKLRIYRDKVQLRKLKVNLKANGSKMVKVHKYMKIRVPSLVDGSTAFAKDKVS